MDLELTDKVAVVTGASKGIGLAVARAFVDEGAHVIAGARSSESLDGVAGITAVAVDLAAPEGPSRLIDHAVDEHGRVDILVNNVGGVRLRLEGFLGTSDDEFEWAMQMNFFTALRATRAALGPMLEQGKGAVVNNASVNAFFQPDAATIDYGAAKAGIGGFATGRFSTPEEVADLILLLSSERASNVTGANYVIDGGLIKTT